MYCPCDVRSLCTREARIETAAYSPVDISVIAIPTLQGSPSWNKYLLGVQNMLRVVLKIQCNKGLKIKMFLRLLHWVVTPFLG